MAGTAAFFSFFPLAVARLVAAAVAAATTARLLLSPRLLLPAPASSKKNKKTDLQLPKNFPMASSVMAEYQAISKATVGDPSK